MGARKALWIPDSRYASSGMTEFKVTLMARNSKAPCVYLLTNKPCGTLYLGVTSNLVQRVWQHKQHLVEGFTKRYVVDILVWFEQHDEMLSAISREKQLKA